MKPYYEADGITIYHGEACAMLAQLPEASVDVLLTDPPYSSGGMFRGTARHHLTPSTEDGPRRQPPSPRLSTDIWW